MQIEHINGQQGKFINFRYVTWDPTYRCNSKCKHCFATQTIKNRPQKELTLKEIEMAIHNLCDKELLIRFVGGEPTVRKDFREILWLCHDMGVKAGFATNGTLLTQDYLKDIKDYVNYVNVSLEGPPHIHNELRGWSCFNYTVRGIKELQRNNVTYGIQFTATARSVPYIPWIVKFGERHKAINVHIRPLIRAGNARNKLDDNFFLNGQQLASIFKTVQYLRDKLGSKMYVSTSIWEKDWFEARFIAFRRNLFNLDQCHIQPDGNMMFFVEVQNDNLCLGNVKKDTIMSVRKKQDFLRKRAQLDCILFHVFNKCSEFDAISPVMEFLLEKTTELMESPQIQLHHNSYFPHKSLTIGGECKLCMHCVTTCFEYARQLDNSKGYVTTDDLKCIGCGNCVIQCPHHAIKLVREDECRSMSIPHDAKFQANPRIEMLSYDNCYILRIDGREYLLNTSLYEMFNLCNDMSFREIELRLKNKGFAVDDVSLNRAISFLLNRGIIRIKT